MKVKQILLLALCSIALLVAYLGRVLYSDSLLELERAQESLDLMQKDATVLAQLKRQKSKIPRELKRYDRANIIGFIEGQLNDAAISKKSISRMTPSERLADKKTGEIELKVLVSLKKTEVEKVMTFLYNIENAGIGLQASSLRFSKSAGKQSTTWDVQAVISCSIKRASS